MKGGADFSQVEKLREEMEAHRAQATEFAAKQVYEQLRAQADSMMMQGSTVMVAKTGQGARLIVRQNDSSQ